LLPLYIKDKKAKDLAKHGHIGGDGYKELSYRAHKGIRLY